MPSGAIHACLVARESPLAGHLRTASDKCHRNRLERAAGWHPRAGQRGTGDCGAVHRRPAEAMTHPGAAFGWIRVLGLGLVKRRCTSASNASSIVCVLLLFLCFVAILLRCRFGHRSKRSNMQFGCFRLSSPNNKTNNNRLHPGISMTAYLMLCHVCRRSTPVGRSPPLQPFGGIGGLAFGSPL